ncbi:type II toxin-antitoxin system Phd/YefM family antitoxin [Rugamonas aquatica]|uniref:Antitoxin n=1 Tax=Rugamonas aquatica TaxID=2743357 RepID=A0A6A7MZT9_9BURK|nr:type II toxin-antitoxin system prevent-host-death family antitoxin [Rugamonas aquatica]MQA38267.1 type II toxin-antitoxin system prevent-host-death family antitoxin [Rugamonas aquatica]
MPTIDINDAKARLAALIDDAANGKEVVLAKDGHPVAQLVAIAKPSTRVKFGTMKGKIWIADDFDAPLPDDIQAAFEGK